MKCTQCCGIESFFDYKEAKKKLKQYKKSGPDKHTKLLLSALGTHANGDKSLLDVGGGIGAIQMEMLGQNISSVTNVDASSAYHKIARELAEEKGHLENINYVAGDFVDASPSLAQHSIVTMDKVICCYPDASQLLKDSTRLSTHLIGLTYPIDNFISRFLSKVANFFVKLKVKDYASFVHSNQLVKETLEAGGFRQVFYKTSFVWQVMVWQKV